MGNTLNEKLVNIEIKLGGTEPAPEVADKLGWHLDYIESLIGGGGSGGGTKLYRHSITFTAQGGGADSFYYVSTSNEVSSSTSVLKGYILCIQRATKNIIGTYQSAPFTKFYSINPSDLSVNVEFSIQFGDAKYSDTVTEL